jgi:hypothetical protein
MRAFLVAASGLSLAACSSVGKDVGQTFHLTRTGMGDAVTAPLRDFNIVKPKLPAALKRAAEDPYRRPERVDCAYLACEIAELDSALGPDLDAPRKPVSLRSRGAVAAAEAALDAVRDVTTGWIPFRSVVRRLTGAEDRDDQVEDAVHAGGIRRAYLKGLGRQQDCPHPAAPYTATVIASDATAVPGGAATAPAPDEPAAQPVLLTGAPGA